MGGRKSPGSKDLSPFMHTSPGEAAAPHVIATDNRVLLFFFFFFARGAAEFLNRICSLTPSEWGLYCFHYLTPPLQWFSFGAASDRMWCILVKLFVWLILFLTLTMTSCVIPDRGNEGILWNVQCLNMMTSLTGHPSWNHMPTLVENNSASSAATFSVQFH